MANITVSSDVDEILKKDTKAEIKEALQLAAFIDTEGTAAINTTYAYFGDLTGAGNETTLTLDDASDTFTVGADSTRIYGNITLKYGATVDSIATVISDDDTHIPTSGAIVDYVGLKIDETSPVTVIAGTGGETHSRYKTNWLKSEITDIDTSFGTSVIETVKFGSVVDSIDNEIFKERANLKFVDFGQIPTVAPKACQLCTDLERVIMRTSNQIGQHAFHGCTSLSYVDLGSEVTDIGLNAFKNCTDLESITIPASVTVISDNAFYGCASLSEVNCYADQSVFPANGNVFLGTASPLVIHAKPNTGWVSSQSTSFQGNDNVKILVDLV